MYDLILKIHSILQQYISDDMIEWWITLLDSLYCENKVI